MSKSEWQQVGCVVVSLFLLTTVSFVGCYGLSKVEYSTGYRDGTIQKLSKAGVFFKTLEGEMILGGLQFNDDGSGGGTMNRQSFHFTVSDAEVAKKIESMPTGKKVRVHYRQTVTKWSPNGSTSYFVTDVENIK